MVVPRFHRDKHMGGENHTLDSEENGEREESLQRPRVRTIMDQREELAAVARQIWVVQNPATSLPLPEPRMRTYLCQTE